MLSSSSLHPPKSSYFHSKLNQVEMSRLPTSVHVSPSILANLLQHFELLMLNSVELRKSKRRREDREKKLLSTRDVVAEPEVGTGLPLRLERRRLGRRCFTADMRLLRQWSRSMVFGDSGREMIVAVDYSVVSSSSHLFEGCSMFELRDLHSFGCSQLANYAYLCWRSRSPVPHKLTSRCRHLCTA